MAEAATIKDAMNNWGREFLAQYRIEVPEGTDITFEDDLRMDGYCETCYTETTVVKVSAFGYGSADYIGGSADLLRSMSEGVLY